ncbi:FK506-binding protein 15-like isoform X2 [Dermacentor andersoni]|uniref:FK506-binding protein 15-like isoform X2 n=1 Tax=Dermacentor andersoni TaxID=34620 RepID=UPI0024161F94|nr:FK506-binding protein 15-like isoform X2 [Dermacentor andersoni]
MHFANDDDDVDFTVQPGSSKLANLFSDNDAAKAGNSSLTYTPPRQPSVGKTTDKQSSSGTLSLLHAAVVQAFKYEGKQPSNQGKLGIAVLGNHDTSNYKLILYKEKQQQLAVAAINAQFTIRVQGNNFLSFVDEKRFNWSVKFDSEEALINFAKQAIIAKAESHGAALVNLDNIISQDLILGEAESEALKIGSTAVIKYTAWVLREHRLKKVLDTTDIDEPQKLKLGRGKQVKGLEEGLVGCRKNSRRFLVLPPSHGYGSKGLGTTVPPNAVLVFDVSVGSIIKSKSATKDSTPRSSTPVSVPAEDAERKESRSHSHGSVDEPARSRAPSAPPDWPPQQLATNPAVAPATAVVSGGESDKARLLSRIARMGAQMLPMPGAVPAQPSSDSEGEDDRSRVAHQVPAAVPLPQPTAREGSPKPVVKPRTFSQHSLGDAVSHPTPVPPTLQPMVNSYASGPAAPTMPATPHMALYQAQSQLASALAAYPYQQQGLLLPPGAHTYSAAMPSAASVAADMQLPLLLSETRSQNTEVRLNISKLADKVDEILRKLDAAKSQLPSAPLLGSNMDSDVLLYNIQRMVQDNEKLKNDNCEKDQKIQGLTEKICDLLQKNQRLMEESNSMFEQRSDAMHSSAAHSQARLLALETEKMEVTERLTQALSELSLLRAELSERQQKESQELEGLRSASEGKEGTLKSLEDRLMKEAEQQRKQFEEAIETYEKKLAACNEMHVTKDSAAENLKQSLASCNKECSELQTQIHQLKRKHKEEIDSLESRISQLIGEAESKCQELEKQKQLQQENQASGAASTSATASFNFEAELKKIMNVLFKLLQREFSSQETYSRKEAMQIILATIREYTTEVLQRRQAPSASNSGTSRSSPASTASSSTGSPSASGTTSATTSALTSAPTSEAAAPQLSKNLDETGKQEGKNNGSLDTPATEEPLSEAPTGPAGNVVSGHHSKRPEHAPEDSHSKKSVDKIAETAEEPGQHKAPVTQAGDEKETGDSTKEGASGDARLSSSAEGKTGPEPPAQSESVQPQDWSGKKHRGGALWFPHFCSTVLQIDLLHYSWKPQPPPPPLFDEYEDDDWLN